MALNKFPRDPFIVVLLGGGRGEGCVIEEGVCDTRGIRIQQISSPHYRDPYLGEELSKGFMYSISRPEH
jgi:hypothetical protein